MNIDKSAILQEIVSKTIDIDGRKHITCTDSIEIAKKMQVDPNKVREICDENQIKIYQCKLGCF